MAETCERLVAAGLPLWRVAVFVRTLHPDIFGRAFFWRPGTEVIVNPAGFETPDSPEYKSSPLAILYDGGQEVRYRLDDPESRRFPFFDDMRAEGVTDYIALPLLFIDGSIHASSWTTKQASGFSDDELAALRTIVTPLTRIIEIVNLRRTSLSLLDSYVGNSAGERIMGGQIRRGHADTMHAAIWLSDLRGFTALSDRLPAETVVDILNRYFDCQVSAIRSHGGEVLKFMGDGLLAVFPIAEADGDIRRRLRPRARSRAGIPRQRRRHGLSESETPSSDFVSGSRCMSERFSTAISAAATGSTSPASVPPSISRHGWRRSPAASTARSWRRKGLPAFAPAAGPNSANFRSRDLQRPSGSTAWWTKAREVESLRYSSGSVVNSSG